ncbi:MAG: hypothetical protein JWR16_1033 [Nevskia sp.]|nr:hypothetical protein [Nevskia sp.]
MNFRNTIPAALLLGTLAAPVFAQGTPSPQAAQDAAINAREQQRIDAGLKSGQLSTEEAARLEKQQSHIEQQEQRDMKNGAPTPAEQARIHQQQEQASKDIHEYKNDAVHGNPNAESSQRLQSDIQRNASQQQRISNGLQSGALNNREAGSLEHGQADSNRLEEHAAANGHVNAHQQAEISRSETHQSQNIHAKKQSGQR